DDGTIPVRRSCHDGQLRTGRQPVETRPAIRSRNHRRDRDGRLQTPIRNCGYGDDRALNYGPVIRCDANRSTPGRVQRALSEPYRIAKRELPRKDDRREWLEIENEARAIRRRRE